MSGSVKWTKLSLSENHLSLTTRFSSSGRPGGRLVSLQGHPECSDDNEIKQNCQEAEGEYYANDNND